MVKVLAVEDGSFKADFPLRRRGKNKAFLVCVLVEDFRVEEVFLSYVTVDGLDATKRLAEILKRIKKKLDVVLLASVAYAGFNLIDPIKIHEKFGFPVLVVNPKKPNEEAVKLALKKHFNDWEKRLKIIQKVGKPSPLKIGENKTVYVYSFGLPLKEAEKLLRRLTVFGGRPEPLRVADLIARGLGFAC